MLGAQLNAIFGTQGALAILGDISTGLTATGTNQATALALTASTNIVSTVGAGAGARLPVSASRDAFIVANYGASALMVYPPSTGRLNNATANVGAMIVPNKAGLFICLDTVNYLVILSA